MPEAQSTASVVSTSPAGTPVIVQPDRAPIVVQSNPLMDMGTWAPLIVFLLGVAAIVALFTNGIKNKITEFKDQHKPVHDNIDREIAELKHDTRNLRNRQDASEQLRGKDEARFVKLEAEIGNFKEGLTRIETLLKENGNSQNKWNEAFDKSLREVREVKPKDGH